jgi:hypothetical protein
VYLVREGVDRMSDPTVYAVAPRPSAWRIHLYVDGYTPPGFQLRRPKSRSVKSPLCGAFVSGLGQARMVPIREALHWPDRRPTAEDMRPRQAWCPSCLGHASDLLGFAANLALAIANADNMRSSEAVPVQGQMVTWELDTGSSAPFVTGGLPVGPIT